ncbi:hypothetical protein ACFSQ3_01015 [Sphingobacterium corticis]|uniref:Terminase small subunit n=1 Tax=Sphingobacterium corticis TaxID=1812823 RepID=A0ABW5NEA7_9SPHI
MGVGRPDIWIEEKRAEAIEAIINRICDGESLRSILLYANRDILPSMSLFLKWVSEDNQLKDQYARAMDIRSDMLFDEILEIADESNADTDLSDEGKMIIRGDIVQRSRLRIDARKWALSKMQPKKYGDRLDVDHTSSDGSMSAPTKIVFTRGSNPDGSSGEGTKD